MPFLDNLLQQTLGQPNEAIPPSQVIAQAKPPAATPTMGPAIPPKPSEILMPPTPEVSKFNANEEVLQDDPDLDLSDPLKTGRAEMRRLMAGGVTGQDFQPVLQSSELRDIILKNQKQLDELYEKSKRSPEELTQEEINRRFGRGWGGLGKRLLTELMLGVGGESVTGRMKARYEGEQKQATSLYNTLRQSQNQLLTNARSMDTTYAKLYTDDVKARLTAFNSVINAKDKTENLALKQQLADANSMAKAAGANALEARAKVLNAQADTALRTGNINLDRAQSSADAYAHVAMASDPKYAQEFQANPTDPNKWSPETFAAYKKAFDQGILEYERAKANARPNTGASTIRTSFVDSWKIGPTGVLEPVMMAVQTTKDGQIRMSSIETPGMAKMDKDSRDKLMSSQSYINGMASAFDQVATMSDAERDKNYGIIAHPFIVELKRLGIIPGLDQVKDINGLRALFTANRDWVKYLYTYSGKVVNEREMEAIKGFIPTLLNSPNVYEGLAIISYYAGMRDYAQALPSTLKGPHISASEDASETIKKATAISLNSSREFRGGNLSRVIRLDSGGTQGTQFMLLHEALKARKPEEKEAKLQELTRELGVTRKYLDMLMSTEGN